MVHKVLLCCLALLFSCFIIQTVETMTVIPGRANITYLNTKYIPWGVFNVRRYSRRSPYYLNIYGNTTHTWTNNVTIHVILKQFLSNEYRRSFIEFHYKFCDLVNGEPFIGDMLKKAGVTCPFPAGDHNLMNMTVQTQTFPNLFPFEKGSADVTLTVTETGETIGQGFLEAEFKQKLLRH